MLAVLVTKKNVVVVVVVLVVNLEELWPPIF